MTSDADGSLPRWAGITEPTTVATNVVLAGLAFVLGTRLGYSAAAEGSASGSFLALGLLATAVAASFGAAAHGIDPGVDREQRERCWRASLYAMGFVGAAVTASVAFFTARGSIRTAILVVAGLKCLAYLVSVRRRPEFRVAAADYGGALAVLLVAALYAMARWHAAGMGWIVGGVAVSLVAGLVQARRIAFHRHFNHNDLFHLIQMVAVYLFYRGGALLVDR
jgi:general stress protein CsbA